MVSVKTDSLSEELAANANDSNFPLRIVVKTTALFFKVPSCSPNTDTVKLWPEKTTGVGDTLVSLLCATQAFICPAAFVSSVSETALRG